MPRNDKLYDNCKIYFKTGEFSAYISKGKMEWYLEKGLAYRIDDISIKLNLDVVKKDNGYGSSIPRNNICSVCGEDKDLKKFSFVGNDFRKCFPINHKSHRGDLIILLCLECQEEAVYINSLYKNAIIDWYTENEDDNVLIDKKMSYLKKYAKEIISKKKYLKKETILNKEAHNKLIEYFGRDYTDEDLEEIIKKDNTRIYDGLTFYEYVIKKIIDNNKLKEFEDGWIKNFLKFMRPEFLPDDIMERLKPLMEEIEKENKIENENI